jgi:integrase
MVPVHSKLIELGLLEYVERTKQAGKLRLFPELTYDPKNKWGRQLSRWFNDRFLVQLGLKSSRLTFHSLRHTMVHRQLNANVEDAIVKAVVGHKAEGVTQATYNRAGYSIERKRAALEAYAVPEKATDTDCDS